MPWASWWSPTALRELHPEDVLAGREPLADELLLRRHADEAVHVEELAVLDEEGVAAEAGAVGDDHALGVRVRDLDVGEDLERPAPDVRRRSLGSSDVSG